MFTPPFFDLQKAIDNILIELATMQDYSAQVAELAKIRGYTVATLPTGVIGMRFYVTDATAPAYNAALVGGGAVTVPVFYNGAAWVSA